MLVANCLKSASTPKYALSQRLLGARDLAVGHQQSTIAAMSTAVVKLEHHEQHELCRTRAPYRQGRKLTAVKVYTVNDESQHLMICGVPKLQLRKEIKSILVPYGSVKKIESVTDYPTEEFTEAFHVHFERIQSASCNSAALPYRIAKRFVDGKNFYGGLLHVFYAPELESVAETRNKLLQRRKDIAVRLRRHREDPIDLSTDKFEPREQYHRKKKFPALPLTEQRLAEQYPSESLATIYDGIPRDIDPRPVSEPSLPTNWSRERERDATPDPLSAPYNKSDALGRAVTSGAAGKRKNYRGRPVNERVKVRVIRPQIIDTTKLGKFGDEKEQKVLPVVKKVVDSGITIKVLPNRSDGKKRIVVKDPSVPRLVQPSDDLGSSIAKVKSSIRDAMKNGSNK